MIIHSSIVTSWAIKVPTGDPEMPFIGMGSWFKTKEDAQKDLRGWREELQKVAIIEQITWEDWTAHEA